MTTFLLLILQCGSFVLIPTASFGVGLWLIRKFVGMENPKSQILMALVIGFSFFEASTIGMLIDPRGGFSKLPEIIKTSSLLGLLVALSVLVFVPLYREIVKLFK